MDPRHAALLFAILTLVDAAAAPPPLKHEDDTLTKVLIFAGECKCEMKLADDDVTGLDKKVQFSPKTKCLIKCVAQKLELFKGGKLDEKEVMEWIEEERADNATLAQKELLMYKACKTITGTDECDTATKLFLCVRDFATKNLLTL